jgi:hypothetical protein
VTSSLVEKRSTRFASESNVTPTVNVAWPLPVLPATSVPVALNV